jgi:hypothetical protein
LTAIGRIQVALSARCAPWAALNHLGVSELPTSLMRINAPWCFSGDSLKGGGQPAGGCAPAMTEESQPMLDVFMLVIGIGFFAVAVAYASACDRL